MNTADIFNIWDELKRAISEPTRWEFRCLSCGHGFNSEQAKVIEEPHMYTVACPKCGLSEIETQENQYG